MKKISSILLLTLGMSISFINNANASQDNEPLGGYAVVNPETGVVHGVIVARSSDPFQNGGVMPAEYMGCPAGCIIVHQSTADSTGNVIGKRSQDGGNDVTYDSNRNVFQVVETSVVQSQTVTESASNTSAIETDISVSHSTRVYEFGVQDFINNPPKFQMNEVAPPQNTSVQVSTDTKEFLCQESGTICSKQLSNASNTLSEEVTLFSERKTSEQVLVQVVSEAKTKIREQINLILSMLEKWILN